MPLIYQLLSAWNDVLQGARLFFGNPLIRLGVAIEFVSPIAGEQIVVKTIGHVKDGWASTATYCNWMMGEFRIGTTVAAFGGGFDTTTSRRVSLIVGALLLGRAIAGTNYVSYPMRGVLWATARLEQSLASTTRAISPVLLKAGGAEPV